MQGCARTCLLWLVGWAAGAALFYVYLRRFGELRPQIWWACGVAGFCAVTTVSYVLAIITFAKERSMLLGAVTGQPPLDGQWVAVSGTIRSNEPLRAPLTGTTSVAYTYEMSRMESSSHRNSSSSKVTYYEGKALAPSTISSKQGAIRLLAVPTLDVPPEKTDTPAALENAVQYVETTGFETNNTPKSERTGLKAEATDDDGMFRVDKHHADSKVDLSTCTLEERHIKQGEQVCAFGLYSAARGGLIPHPNWSRQARIMRGDATTVADQLRKRILKYAIGLAIFAAGAYGIAKLYETHAIRTAPRDTAQLIEKFTVRFRYESTG